MDDFKRRTKVRKILYSPITASILLVFIFFVGNASVNGLRTYLETRANYKAALADFEKLESRKENIENRIESLRTERGMEEEIRNKFGFIKEGEEVIIIVEPPVSLGEAENGEEEGGARFPKNILTAILNIFK